VSWSSGAEENPGSDRVVKKRVSQWDEWWPTTSKVRSSKRDKVYAERGKGGKRPKTSRGTTRESKTINVPRSGRKETLKTVQQN